MAQSPNPPSIDDLTTSFERDQNTTATYDEAIEYYKKLSLRYPDISVATAGLTDSGLPLTEVIVTNDGVFSPDQIRANNKVILFINNAIHPGEPCGVDASMMIARDLQTKHRDLLEHAVVVLIPIYNISGHLNRGSHSRANQNGPKAYGFRGNAQNLDLNRDFIKTDTKNARSFNKLYTKWSPEVFVDNHTSNGADYQYVMTLIATQKDKMEPSLATYMTESMLPDLYQKMAEKNYEMTPYVYANTTPDEGIAGFLDLPRYSSGYASLHNAISFMPETHMLKPFADRVKSTYFFSLSMLEHIDRNHDQLIAARKDADKSTKTKLVHDIAWEIDKNVIDTVSFKGYTAKYKVSKVTGQNRLYYDHDEPYTKDINHYNTYTATISIDKPRAYIIPQAYSHIIDKMTANGVQVEQLDKSKMMDVEIYRIEDFSSPSSPYEGRYLHRAVEVSKSMELTQYHEGDFIIYLNQPIDNYIVHTLEPQAPDSWFAWNYFDGILMQKEHFSPYVFEDLAERFLQKNPNIRMKLESKKLQNPDFAKDAFAQLQYVYEQTPHYEPTYNRYPVGRLMEK